MSLGRDLAEAARDVETEADLYTIALEVICGSRGWPAGCVSFVKRRDPHSADGDGTVPGEIEHVVDSHRFGAMAEAARALVSSGSCLTERVLEEGSTVGAENLSPSPRPESESSGPGSTPDATSEPKPNPTSSFASPAPGAGPSGALAVPVVDRSGIRAVLHFFDAEPRSLAGEDLSEMDDLGSQLGWMLELVEGERKSRNVQSRLEKFVEAIRTIGAAGMDPDQVMQVTAEQAQQLTGATSAGVYLRAHEDRDVMILRGASGNAVPYRGRRVSISETLSGQAFERGEVLVSNDTRSEPRVSQQVVEETGLRALIAVPLQADAGRIVGLLNVMSNQPHVFDDGDAHLLRLLSEQMGRAVERARAFRANERLLEDLSDTAKALEEALEEQEAILDASLHAIIAMDAELNVTLWSRAAEELYGWSENEIVGAALPFLPDSRRDEAVGNIRRVLGGATLRNLDVTHRRKDGSPVEVRLSAAPARSAHGEAGVVAVIMDMSEIRKVEAHLRQAERMESVGRLAGGIAHDFNNMLTAMRGNADLLLTSDLPPQDKESVQGILDAVERAEAVTRQLLAYSRRQHLEARPVYPAEAIREMSSLLERLLGERVSLTLDLDDDAGPVVVDPAQLDQVVMNLVLNGRDSMPDGGEIRVACTRIDARNLALGDLEQNEGAGWIELSVSDEGQGVPAEIRDRIFEPFFSTKSPGQGTGLGLATVYGVVHQSGGAIRLETTMGAGSTFHVYLPVVDP